MKKIDFATARRGMFLMDEYDQRCRVVSVSRKHSEIKTRRYEFRRYWDCVALWTPEAFNGRHWIQVRSGPRGPT